MPEVTLNDVAVRGPDGSALVVGATGTLEGLTYVHGRSGSGAGALLAALTAHLPPGSRVRGQAMVGKLNLLRAAPEELTGVVTQAGLHTVPGVRTGEFLSWLRTSPDELGLSKWTAVRTRDLPPDLRARLAVAQVISSPATPVLVVHPLLAPLDPVWRRRLADELRRRATEGQTVVWWDDDPDTTFPVADHTWAFRGPRVTPDALVAPPEREQPVSDRRRPVLTTVSAEQLGLHGPDLEVADGETLGLVRLEGRIEPVARTLTGLLPQGAVMPSRMGGREASAWARQHGITTPAPSLSRSVGPDPHESTRWLLARQTPVPLWFPHPQLGLDSDQRAALLDDLRDPVATRLVTTRDVDLLQRGCHRIVVVRGDELVRVGAPAAVRTWLEEEA